MKKILLYLSILFIFPLNVLGNTINKIDMKIILNKDGSADITEYWDVKGTDGTEWYKVLNDVDENRISNFTVSMDNNPFKIKEWNVSESLTQKRGYYGINNTNNGIELCFGKYDYKHHNFIVSYTIKDYILTTDDSQVIYWTLIGQLSNVDFKDFTVDISGYYNFPDTLDVWGYGYKGYAYVENGHIKLSNSEDSTMDDNYVVLLAKFPLETFDNTYKVDGYDSFNTIYQMAQEGSFNYDYNTKEPLINRIFGTLFNIIIPCLWIGGFSLIIYKVALKNSYGYKGNKKIDYKNLNMFRDIPCNKDIFYANTLLYLNKRDYKETNILGAIFLKWVKEDKIAFNNSTGIFNKNTSTIDLTRNPVFDNELETNLFKVLYEASGDGILETKELERWCKKHYDKFFNIFNNFVNDYVSKLKEEGQIWKRVSKEECKCLNVLSDKIYEDSNQLYGLKLFLKEFASMNNKEVLEVKLWDEYLMFAYLFGIADKVASQMKNLYPEVFEQYNYDYNTVIFINNISSSSVSAASSARSAAENYSSGGGGFSSGGGGGGSFGGGGGGSR